jgi:tetratricopeptide (TPR) repeat protein
MDDSTAGNSNSSSFGSPFMLGQGLVQARISPASSAWSAKPRRFFDSETKPAEKRPDISSTIKTPLPQNNDKQQQPQAQPQDNSSIVDGINLSKLRALAQESMGNSASLATSSPSMAVFYASLVHAKTLSPQDAFFYAQALRADGQAKRCVRLLEQSGLLSTPSDLRLEAVLLASQALTTLGEWQNVLVLLEDASNHGDNWSPTLEDDDDIAWQTLADSILCPPNYIHPLSRLCLCRGRAYSETGHPLRAALFWKRALKIDPLCVEALDSLLSRSVVTSQQAYEVIMDLHFSSDMDWLKQLYFARVDLSPQDTSNLQEPAAATNAETVSTPFMSGNDASSIQLMTPSFQQHGDLSADNLFFGDDNHKTPGAATSLKDAAKSAMQTTVDSAFEKLWSEHKLQKSSEVLAMAARRAYRRYDLKNALKYCQELASVDPLCQTAGFVYMSTLVALGHKRLLFRLAHEWVEASPKSARAWFAVGSYYYTCERYHVAQRHFCRATRLDPHCTEAWIAFGCSFAACDESDQALASFRAAQRLAPGEYSSLLYIGMEYLRTNHLVLAQHFLTAASKASGGDPVCLNELGVLAFQQQDYPTAIRWFSKAIQASVGDADDAIDCCQDKYWEPTLFNLGQAYRKTRKFENAVRCFERSLTLRPVSSFCFD